MKTAFSTAILTFCLIATSLTANTFGQARAKQLGSIGQRITSGVSTGWYEEPSNPNQIWVDSRIFNQVMNRGIFYTYWYPASHGKQYCEYRRIVRSSGTTSNIRGQMYMLVTLASKKETGYYTLPSGGHVGGNGGGYVSTPSIAGVYRDTRIGAVSTVIKTGHNTYRWSSDHGHRGTLTWNGSSIQLSDGNYSTNIRFTGNMPNTINWKNGYTWVRQ